jgi:hypothetical protein
MVQADTKYYPTQTATWHDSQTSTVTGDSGPVAGRLSALNENKLPKMLKFN